MKKAYTVPSVEIVKFQYRDQVVAASGSACTKQWIFSGDYSCDEGNELYAWVGNQS